MKKIIALEELAQLVVCIYIILSIPNHFNAIQITLLFFLPDAFAIGFLINNKLGTILYNFSHHKLVALVLISFGFITKENTVLQIGLITYAHSSFDRTIGYGLKFLGNPSKTHLGFVGKEKNKNAPDTF